MSRMDRDFEALLKGADGRSRRIFQRRRQEGLTCSLGPVLDLSKGGARVLAKGPFRGHREIGFESRVGLIRLTATVAWSRKLGFRRWVLGLQFVGVSPRLAHDIAEILKAHAPELESRV